MPEKANRFITLLRRLEDGLLALLLGGMISIAAVQVILRNFFDSGLLWGDSAVRILVLWVAIVGAMVASRSDEHIRIDLVNHFLTDFAKAHVKRVVNLFTCLILGVFAYTSLEFVQFEYEDQTIAFASVPSWVCAAVIPLGTGLMALRYALQTIWPKP